MDTDTKMRTNGHDFRFCSECGHEYDARAGKCPFCAEGQPAEFQEEAAAFVICFLEGRQGLPMSGLYVSSGHTPAAVVNGVAAYAIVKGIQVTRWRVDGESTSGVTEWLGDTWRGFSPRTKAAYSPEDAAKNWARR